MSIFLIRMHVSKQVIILYSIILFYYILYCTTLQYIKASTYTVIIIIFPSVVGVFVQELLAMYCSDHSDELHVGSQSPPHPVWSDHGAALGPGALWAPDPPPQISSSPARLLLPCPELRQYTRSRGPKQEAEEHFPGALNWQNSLDMLTKLTATRTEELA